MAKLFFAKKHPGAVSPRRHHAGDSGFDLAAAEPVDILPGETMAVQTGIAFNIPAGYEIQIRPRSGVSLKTPLRVVFGTIDSSYRGAVAVICQNQGITTYKVKQGQRLAQAVLMEVPQAELIECDCVDTHTSTRGESGFGSTGDFACMGVE